MARPLGSLMEGETWSATMAFSVGLDDVDPGDTKFEWGQRVIEVPRRERPIIIRHILVANGPPMCIREWARGLTDSDRGLGVEEPPAMIEMVFEESVPEY
uniref:Uncharacterized protein n=1 Tax=Eutreptiella gymnastica TaxID=73025 RepID=A0A7S1IQ66_9EUGL